MITLAVSYFEDSLDRKNNLKKFLDYWKQYPVKIDIEKCKTFTPLMSVYNKLANRCTTEYIAFTDVDVYFDYKQLELAKDVADLISGSINSQQVFVSEADITTSQSVVEISEGRASIFS